jgi:Fe-S-cluster containining protein
MLLFSPEQRFTCAECGRCCRRATVAVTSREAESYRNAGAERWFRESDTEPAVTPIDVFEPILEHAPLLRIRKRSDGACGFLSPEGRCRIHEEMGGDRKPLSCRLFPFRFHPANNDVVVSASFACPTVIASKGATLASQKRELQVLQTAWAREFPEAAATVELTSGHTLPRPALPVLRKTLCEVLDRPSASGRPDLRANLRRIAALLEDLSRSRVRKLSPDRFIEYLGLVGGYAVKSDKPPKTQPPSRLSRLLFRGFLLAALSVQTGLDPILAWRRTALRAKLLRLAAHLHGLAPGTPAFDFRRAVGIGIRLEDPEVHAVVHRFLKTGFETVGTGRRPIVDEVSMLAAQLNAACVFGGMHAIQHGKHEVDAESFSYGLLEASDLSHADAGGFFSSLLTTLAGGPEALYMFPPLLLK